MAKLARNKKFVKLEDVRVSYRAHDDTVHLSSGDPDFPTGFHLPLSKGTAIEAKVRELLKEFDLIDPAVKDLHDDLPLQAELYKEYFTDPAVPIGFFPIGVGLKSDVVVKHPRTGAPVPLIGFQTGHRPGESMGSGMESALAPHVLIAGHTGGGKSVLQRNIILGALARREHWDLLLIDLHIVELSCWRDYRGVLGVATSMGEALATLRFAYRTMMQRYAAMEEKGVNHYHDFPSKLKGLLVVVDEITSLLKRGESKTPAGLARDALAEEASDLIAMIAQLGRAAGVHLVLSTQRPDAGLLTGETMANLGVRIQCGKANKIASQLAIGNDAGTEVRANPRGRIYIRIYGDGKHGQGLYAAPDWGVNELNLERKGPAPTGPVDELWALQGKNFD